jgi:hypothetical protein
MLGLSVGAGVLAAILLLAAVGFALPQRRRSAAPALAPTPTGSLIRS